MNFWLCILMMIESSRVSAPGTGDITLLLCTDPSGQRGRESESWGEIGALSLTPGGDSGLLTNQRAGLGAVDQSEAGCRFCRMGHKDGYVTGRNWLLGLCDPCCGWYQVNIMPPFRLRTHYLWNPSENATYPFFSLNPCLSKNEPFWQYLGI